MSGNTFYYNKVLCFLNKGINYIILITVLVTMIIVRIFISTDSHWILVVNMLCFDIAVYNLHKDFKNASSEIDSPTVNCTFILLEIILTIVVFLVSIKVIRLNNLFNDLILLGTLLVSLPSRFYVALLTKKYIFK